MENSVPVHQNGIETTKMGKMPNQDSDLDQDYDLNHD